MRFEINGVVKHRKSIYAMDEYKLIEDGSRRVFEIRDFVRNFRLEDKIDGKRVRIVFEVLDGE